jgi:hypothetical protein
MVKYSVNTEDVAALSPLYLPDSSNADILTADKENAHLMEEVSTLHFNTIWWTNL